VPTKKAFAEGSYETVNSRVKPGGGEMLVKAAVGENCPVIDWVHFYLREFPTRQEPSIFWRKTRIPWIQLSDRPVNSKWPNFATETKLPSRDSSRKLSQFF
jgi:hypothetical protein